MQGTQLKLFAGIKEMELLAQVRSRKYSTQLSLKNGKKG